MVFSRKFLRNSTRFYLLLQGHVTPYSKTDSRQKSLRGKYCNINDVEINTAMLPARVDRLLRYTAVNLFAKTFFVNYKTNYFMAGPFETLHLFTLESQFRKTKVTVFMGTSHWELIKFIAPTLKVLSLVNCSKDVHFGNVSLPSMSEDVR